MVAVLALVSSLVAAASTVQAGLIPHHHRALAVARSTVPEGWVTDIMESYDAYHARYLALDCEAKHDTAFFTSCCHPMKANETLATARDADCDPANLSSSSAVASATATSAAATSSATTVNSVATGSDDDEEDDCDDEDDSGDDDDEEDCDDETTSAAATSTHAAASTTHVAATSTHKASSSAAAVTSAAAESTSVKVATSSAAAVTSSSSKAAATSSAKPTTSKAAATTEAATTTTKKATSTKVTSSAAATSTSSSDGTWITGGFATFFYQEGAAGSCGNYNSDSTPLVAVQEDRMTSSLCGKQVEITNTANGKTVTATVQDTCPGCANANSLDLSTGAFDAIGDESTGVLDIKWKFLD